MTKKELLYEYARCAVDISYFASKYVKVWDKKSQSYIPFNLLPQQKQVLETYEKSNRVIISKYRQGGITALTCLYLAHALVFRNDIKVGVAANKLKLAKETIFYQIVSIIKKLPENIFNRIPTDSDNKELKIYNNGAQIQAFAASSDGLRGFAPDILFIDEAAFLEEGDAFMASADGTLASGGQIILNSTPKGFDPVYYPRYEGAKTGLNNYTVVEIYWYEDPRYSEDLIWVKGDDIIYDKNPENFIEHKKNGYRPSSSWFRDMCQTFNNDPKKIAQELENKFLGSGGNLVDNETIEKINKQVKKPIKTEFDGKFYIWEKPMVGYDYFLACDVGKGASGGDYSTIQIFKNDVANYLLIQVAEYQNRVPLEIIGDLTLKYAKLYNNAYVIVDITGGWGLVPIKILKDNDYTNLHYDKPREHDVKVQMKEYAMNDLIPGFTVKNGPVRDFVLQEFERRLREGEAIIYSERLLSEIKTFVFDEKKNRYDHTRSTHDDLLMATGMIFAVYMQSKSNTNELNMYLQIAQSMIISKSDEFLDKNDNDINRNKYYDVENEINKEWFEYNNLPSTFIFNF
jgi:hypothetical protein